MSDNKTIKEIVKEYLRKNKYDGLYYPGECGCKLSDLFPCEGWGGDAEFDCIAGYLNKCPEDCGEHDFHIEPIKKEVKSVDVHGRVIRSNQWR